MHDTHALMDFLFAFGVITGGGGVTGGVITGGGVTGGVVTGGVVTGGDLTGGVGTGGVVTGGFDTGVVVTGGVATGGVLLPGLPAVDESGDPEDPADFEPTVVTVVVVPALATTGVADTDVLVAVAPVTGGVTVDAATGIVAVDDTAPESAVSLVDIAPVRSTVPMTVPAVLALLDTGASLELLPLAPQPARGRHKTSEVSNNDLVDDVPATAVEEMDKIELDKGHHRVLIISRSVGVNLRNVIFANN